MYSAHSAFRTQLGIQLGHLKVISTLIRIPNLTIVPVLKHAEIKSHCQQLDGTGRRRRKKK